MKKLSVATATVLVLFAQSLVAEPDPIQDAISLEDFDRAEYLLTTKLATRPADPDLRFLLARVLGWSGKYDASLAEYDALLSAFPDNVDFILEGARVQAWAGRDQEALANLHRARELAPNYEAVWQLQYEILLRAGSAEERTEFRENAAERFPEATWWREPAPQTRHRWYVTLGAGHEDLSTDLPSWNHQFLRLDWERSQEQSYFAEIAHDERYGESDSRLALGGEWDLADNWSAGIALSLSPDSQLQPEDAFSLNSGRIFARGWGFDLRLGHRRYSNATVSMYTATMERYFGDYRAAYGVNVSRLHGSGDSLAHVASIGWYPNQQWGLALMLSAGEEAEVIGTAEVLETEVESLTLTGRYRVGPRTSIDWWLGTHRQGDFYRRRYAGLAVKLAL